MKRQQVCSGSAKESGATGSAVHLLIESLIVQIIRSVKEITSGEGGERRQENNHNGGSTNLAQLMAWSYPSI
jgi:hypothetical protein